MVRDGTVFRDDRSDTKKQPPKLIYREGDVNLAIKNLPREKPILNINDKRNLTCCMYTWGDGGYRIVPFLVKKNEDEFLALRKVSLLDYSKEIFKEKEESQKRIKEELKIHSPKIYDLFMKTADECNGAFFDVMEECVTKEGEQDIEKIANEHNRIREELRAKKDYLIEQIGNDKNIPLGKKGSYSKAAENLDHLFSGELIIGRDASRSDIPIANDKLLSDQQGLLTLSNDVIVYLNIGLNGSLPLKFSGSSLATLESRINGRNPIISLKDPSYQLTYLFLNVGKVPQLYEEFKLSPSFMVLEYPSL